MDKFKTSIETVSKTLGAGDYAISKVIKKNMDWMQAHQKLSALKKIGLQEITEFSNKETPDLDGLMQNFTGTLDAIEKSREKLFEDLQREFIGQLEIINQEWKDLQQIIKRDTIAQEKKDRAEKNLKRVSAKTAEKQKPEELVKAHEEFANTTADAKHTYDDAVAANAKFNDLKRKFLQQSLNSLWKNERAFYTQALHLLGG